MKSDNRGFSLLEVLIAMTISLVILGVASTLLATSFNVRNREQSRTDSIADVQRALNIMSREISNGGYGFDPATNGLVVGDCDASSIRVIANLNKYSSSSTTIESSAEDVKYLVDATDDQNYLVRHDRFPPALGSQSTVLANRIDTLTVDYFGPNNTALDVTANPSLVSSAVAVRLTVRVNLLEVGTTGTPGYQPATTVQLTTDVTLRNKSENRSTY